MTGSIASPLAGQAQARRHAKTASRAEPAYLLWEEAGSCSEKAPLRVRGLVIAGSAAALWAAILLALV